MGRAERTPTERTGAAPSTRGAEQQERARVIMNSLGPVFFPRSETTGVDGKEAGGKATGAKPGTRK